MRRPSVEGMPGAYPGQYCAMPPHADDGSELPEEGAGAPQHPSGPIPLRPELTPEERRKGLAKDDERLRSDPTRRGTR